MDFGIETWDDKFPPAEDWDNEEYTGSLADSQVFTKSDLDGVIASEAIEETSNQDLLAMSTSTSQDFHQSNALPSSPLPVGVGTLNSAQAQYLVQLTQQSSENLKVNQAAAAAAAATAYGQTESLKSAVGIGGTGSFAQSTVYGQTNTYGQTNYSQTSYAAPASYPASTGYAATSATSNAYSAAASAPNAYSTGTGAFPQPTQGYQGSNTSYGVYPSSGGSYGSQGYSGSYDGSTATSDTNTQSSQPQRTKVPRPRMPPPSKVSFYFLTKTNHKLVNSDQIPSTAVEMPEDPISNSVNALDVQFGCLEFGTDGTTFEAGVESTNKFSQPPVNSSVDAVSSGAVTEPTPSQQASLNAYSASKVAGTGANQPSAIISGGLAAKGVSIRFICFNI